MRDVYEIIREKQLSIKRLKWEIRALQLAVPLLSEESDLVPETDSVLANFESAAHEPQNAAGPNLVYESARQRITDGAKKISSRMKRLAAPLLTARRLAI